MEQKSLNNPSRRRRGHQSGGGNRNRNNRNRNRNRNSGGNRNQGNRSGGGNRSRNNRNRSRYRKPKQTKWQKFLSTVTFGLLGKPKLQHRAEKKSTKPATEAKQAQSKKKSSKRSPRRNRTEVTSGRLYVGNLVYDAVESDLEELFKGAGNVVSAEVVTNSRTQQSKGFAFVEMGSIDEAKRAVQILDDEDFRGRKLIVSGARSEGPRDDEDSNAQESSSDANETSAPSAESVADAPAQEEEPAKQEG